jgi:hypothetical protein
VFLGLAAVAVLGLDALPRMVSLADRGDTGLVQRVDRSASDGGVSASRHPLTWDEARLAGALESREAYQDGGTVPAEFGGIDLSGRDHGESVGVEHAHRQPPSATRARVECLLLRVPIDGLDVPSIDSASHVPTCDV